ncbi:MAG: PAS domain-containing sensor histidine kinase, partial [Bacteroidota bacterium]
RLAATSIARYWLLHWEKAYMICSPGPMQDFIRGFRQEHEDRMKGLYLEASLEEALGKALSPAGTTTTLKRTARRKAALSTMKTLRPDFQPTLTTPSTNSYTSRMMHHAPQEKISAQKNRDFVMYVNKQYEIQMWSQEIMPLFLSSEHGGMYFGFPLSRMLGDGLWQHWEPHLEEALKGEGGSFYCSIPQGGHLRQYEISFQPIQDEDGWVKGINLWGKDVEDRLEELHVLRQQQRLLDSITRSIKEGIFRSHPEHGILFVNEAFVEMFGYDSIEEVMALEPYDLYVDPSRRDDFVAMIRSSDQFSNQEALFKRKDGTSFWGLVSSVRAQDEAGHYYHDGAVRDVTQLREAERLLKDRYEELKKVNDELDRFFYSTSHDLRAPLVSVAGLINIARTEEDMDKMQHYLALMSKSIDKLDHFIKDIISFSQNARLDLQCKEITLQELLEEVIEQTVGPENQDQVKITLDIRQEGAFHSDPKRLAIIFQNLLSNAIHYRDEKKEHCWIKVEGQAGPLGATVAVSDNGVGIVAKYLPKIFNMFYRGTKLSKGSGIGLYITQETIHKLHGQIEANSSEGEGSSFTVSLPSLA